MSYLPSSCFKENEELGIVSIVSLSQRQTWVLCKPPVPVWPGGETVALLWRKSLRLPGQGWGHVTTSYWTSWPHLQPCHWSPGFRVGTTSLPGFPPTRLPHLPLERIVPCFYQTNISHCVHRYSKVGCSRGQIRAEGARGVLMSFQPRHSGITPAALLVCYKWQTQSVVEPHPSRKSGSACSTSQRLSSFLGHPGQLIESLITKGYGKKLIRRMRACL